MVAKLSPIRDLQIFKDPKAKDLGDLLRLLILGLYKERLACGLARILLSWFISKFPNVVGPNGRRPQGSIKSAPYPGGLFPQVNNHNPEFSPQHDHTYFFHFDVVGGGGVLVSYVTVCQYPLDW